MSSEQKKLFLDKFRLPGKVALITGASRGIGRAIALGFAEAGADVVLVSRKLPDLEAVAQEVTKIGRKALPISANVRNLPEIEEVVKKTVEQFKRIDILVNNAGTNPVFGSVFNIDEKAWDVTIGLNLKGYFFLSQAVGRVMKEKGGGSIINVSSEDAFRPELGAGVYSISKAGVLMLTQVLAQEWGQYNIRVNAIAPGYIMTPGTAEIYRTQPEISEKRLKDVPLGRLGQPEDVAKAALFLASDAAEYISGITLIVDGALQQTSPIKYY